MHGLLLVMLLCTSVLAAPKGYVATPNGYMLEECVRTIPSGATVEERDHDVLITHQDGSTRTLPLCSDLARGRPLFAPRDPEQDLAQADAPAAYVGWTEYTAFKYTRDITSFLGYFSVPDRPARRPEVLYIFTGLQNIDWIPVVDPQPTQDFDIIQPVLQYPGNGNEWAVRSWYVTLRAGALASEMVACQPGDVIFGNMTRTGSDSYYIGSTVVSTAKTTVTNAKNARLVSQPWAYNTLECYGCTNCQTYPKHPSNFTQLALHSNNVKVTPNWIANPKPSQYHLCQESIRVNDPSSVTIFFTTPTEEN